MPNRIDTMFSDADRIGSPVLSLFLTVGFPDVATSTQIAEGCCRRRC